MGRRDEEFAIRIVWRTKAITGGWEIECSDKITPRSIGVGTEQSYLLKVVLSYMEMHDQVYQQQCVDSTLVCTYIGNDL